MDEPTEMPFGGRRMWTQGTVCTMGALYRHLANTTERSGDAALCKLTLNYSARGGGSL